MAGSGVEQRKADAMRPVLVLGILLRVLVETGRLGQAGADELHALAYPEAVWGPDGFDMESAVRQAVSPRAWRRHVALQAGEVGDG